MDIRIDSILMYVDSTYGYGKEYPLEGGQCTGFKVREVGESVVLYWNDFPDIPEKSINYVEYMIWKIRCYLEANIKW